MKKSQFIALYAIIVALTLVAAAPFFMFVFLIPMIVVCGAFRFRTGMFAALVFGVVSFSYMWFNADPVSLIFQNAPWIAIVPRLITGALAWWAGAGVRRLTHTVDNRFVREGLPALVVALVASLSNTVLVVGGLVLLTDAAYAIGMTNMGFFVSIIPQATVELIVTMIVCPPLVMALRRGLRGMSLEQELSQVRQKTKNEEVAES